MSWIKCNSRDAGSHKTKICSICDGQTGLTARTAVAETSEWEEHSCRGHETHHTSQDGRKVLRADKPNQSLESSFHHAGDRMLPQYVTSNVTVSHGGGGGGGSVTIWAVLPAPSGFYGSSTKTPTIGSSTSYLSADDESTFYYNN